MQVDSGLEPFYRTYQKRYLKALDECWGSGTYAGLKVIYEGLDSAVYRGGSLTGLKRCCLEPARIHRAIATSGESWAGRSATWHSEKATVLEEFIGSVSD
jgi:hypothetical protein